MTAYTLIPAAPGTVMIDVWVEKQDGDRPRVEEYPVIAWRVPNSNEDDDAPVAVMLGRPDEPYEDYADDDVQDGAGTLSVVGWLMPDGLVASRHTARTRAEFVEKACVLLIDRLDQYLAARPVREPIQLRPGTGRRP